MENFQSKNNLKTKMLQREPSNRRSLKLNSWLGCFRQISTFLQKIIRDIDLRTRDLKNFIRVMWSW